MSVCEHCKSRHSWDCDDGCPYPAYGCNSFELDWNSLSIVCKNAIVTMLTLSEENRKENIDG